MDSKDSPSTSKAPTSQKWKTDVENPYEKPETDSKIVRFHTNRHINLEYFSSMLVC